MPANAGYTTIFSFVCERKAILVRLPLPVALAELNWNATIGPVRAKET